MHWFALCCGALLAFAPPAADSYPRRADIDILGYRYAVVLSDANDEIRMDATIEFRFVAGGRNDLTLDLIGVNDTGRGMVVDAVTDSAGPLSFSHRADRLAITLRQPGTTGTIGRVSIRYHGIPAAALRIGPNRHGARTFASDNWPDLARHWLVGIDHPYDKATSEFIVTAPARYQVVSNGLLLEETDLDGGLRRSHWKQSVPIATWLQTLGVARFAVEHSGAVDGIPIQAWVYPESRQQGFAEFGGPTKKAFRFFNDHVGPYAYEKLANVESTAAGGGMEAATAIGYSQELIGTPRAREVIVHEIAHQWFGNAVTEADWDDVWLSEGFATYFTLLFTEYDAGRDAFVAGLQEDRARVLAFDATHPGYRVVHDGLTDMAKVTTRQTYEKGGWTLHMLRGVIGSEAFWRGIREYYRRYRDANATTDDFRRVMEVTSGRDLGWFFRQWLTRSGAPVVKAGWRHDPATGQVVITLEQTQPGEPFRIPMDVGLRYRGEADLHIERIELTGRRGEFRIASERGPEAVMLDPGLWVLMEATVARTSR